MVVQLSQKLKRFLLFLIAFLFKAYLLAHWLYIFGLNVYLEAFRLLLASLRHFYQFKDCTGLTPAPDSWLSELLCEDDA